MKQLFIIIKESDAGIGTLRVEEGNKEHHIDICWNVPTKEAWDYVTTLNLTEVDYKVDGHEGARVFFP